MFTQEEISTAMQQLELPEQVATLEQWLSDIGIDAAADYLAVFLMGVMIDLDGGAYPADLVARVNRLVEQVKNFNVRRFANPAAGTA